MPKGGKHGLHCIAVRVVADGAASLDGMGGGGGGGGGGGRRGATRSAKEREAESDFYLEAESDRSARHAARDAERQHERAHERAHGWSPPFSLLLGPFQAERAFRAGAYDLAVDIKPVETAARERTKVWCPL